MELERTNEAREIEKSVMRKGKSYGLSVGYVRRGRRLDVAGKEGRVRVQSIRESIIQGDHQAVSGYGRVL